MTPLETYLKAFSNLNRASDPAWPPETLKKAPHKPLFLLALLDLFEKKRIREPFVNTGENLDELDELFARSWSKITALGQPASAAVPFAQLSTEPGGYWKLVPFIGHQINASILNGSAEPKALKTVCEGAELAKNLFEILLDANVRVVMREVVLQGYFTPETAERLRGSS